MPQTTPKPSRYAAIAEYMHSKAARVLWSESTGGGTLTAYAVEGKTILVHFFKSSNTAVDGWEAYIPATSKNDIAATLEALDSYLNPTPAPEPCRLLATWNPATGEHDLTNLTPAARQPKGKPVVIYTASMSAGETLESMLRGKQDPTPDEAATASAKATLQNHRGE